MSDGIGQWNISKNVSLDTILTEKWDIVTLQQSSSSSGDYDTYQPYLNNIIEYIQTHSQKGVKFLWVLTPAWSDGYGQSSGNTDFSSDEMYSKIVSAAQKAYKDSIIEDVLPVGTAVQNARHTDLNNLGDTYGGLTNGIHLQSGLPCKIASYTVCLKLLKYLGYENISICGEKFIVTAEWLDKINAPQEDGDIVGENIENNIIAQKCIIQAVKEMIV